MHSETKSKLNAQIRQPILNAHYISNNCLTAPVKVDFQTVSINQVDPLVGVVETTDRNVVAKLKSWNQMASYFSKSVSTPVQLGGTPFTM